MSHALRFGPRPAETQLQGRGHRRWSPRRLQAPWASTRRPRPPQTCRLPPPGWGQGKSSGQSARCRRPCHRQSCQQPVLAARSTRTTVASRSPGMTETGGHWAPTAPGAGSAGAAGRLLQGRESRVNPRTAQARGDGGGKLSVLFSSKRPARPNGHVPQCPTAAQSPSLPYLTRRHGRCPSTSPAVSDNHSPGRRCGRDGTGAAARGARA